MKRGLVFSLCALAALASTAQAQHVDISLNLRYTDPAEPSLGGKWFLAVKTTHANGVAGLSAYISGIDTAGPGAPAFGTTGIGAGVSAYEAITQGTLGANVNTVGNTPFYQVIGGAVNVVYGQNNAIGGAITPGVGTTSFGGRQDIDPLQNTAWANSTILMSGNFGSTRPAFVANVGPQLNNTDANILGSTTTLGVDAIDATVSLFVRGDSLETLNLESVDSSKGLLGGDANRDGKVDGSDFAILSGNWQTTAANGWDGGDFTPGNNFVDGSDFAILSGNWQQSQIPVSVAGVPEPASVALALVAGLGGLGLIRRRNK